MADSHEPAVEVDKLSYAYPVYPSPKDMLLEAVTGRRRHDLFWALRDVSFKVPLKQRLGIVGPNGSGKSTLLRLITGNLQPTNGTLKVNGVVSAMLSLNSVLNPEESGLQNVRFNLALNGCASGEIERLTDDIIDFAELGPFIYAPVKTYSSGMSARLSFAIGTAISPEILIVDEVLSVGDGYFVTKATERMMDLVDRGKALIFVSHSTAAMRMLCDTVLWLDNGSIRDYGTAQAVLTRYEDDFIREQSETMRSHNVARRKAQREAKVLSVGSGLDRYRIRITGSNPPHSFVDTHYVRRVSLVQGAEVSVIPLTLADLSKGDVQYAIDSPASEWGRMYDHDGEDSRIVCHQSGKEPGAQLLLKAPAGLAEVWRFEVQIEYRSHRNNESLTVEVADYARGVWVPVDPQSSSVTELTGGWRRVVCQVAVPLIRPEQREQAFEAIERLTRSEVQILDIALLADDVPASAIRERQGFRVDVTVEANRPVRVADVGIKITKSDGTYIFWQSSGQMGCNLEDLIGRAVVSFTFADNPFAAGDYFVSAYCGNGWFGTKNFPHSYVFDQKENVVRFIVTREYEAVAFGQVNIRVPVTVRLEQT